MDPEDDVFNCHVCLMGYNDPRILPCGHSFCLRCLLNIAGNRHNFPCPSCRQIVDLKALKDGTVNALPRNFVLRYVMEAKEKASSSLCSEHNKLLDIFCGQCDLVICSKCLSSLHAGHVIADTENVYVERKENLVQFLASTKLWFSKVKQKEESIKMSRLSMQKDADSARGIIAEIFKKWFDALRAQERVMISYVAQETEKRMKVCEEAEKVLQQSLTSLTDAETEINTILRSEKINIVQVYGSVKARHEDFGKRALQDVENCCKLPKGLKILIQAPWMDEAIVNITPIDTVTTEASSGTQKVSDLIEENISLKSLKANFEQYQNETIALKCGHQEEIEKLKEETKELKKSLKAKFKQYQNGTIALKKGHQEAIEKLKEEIKAIKERKSQDESGFNIRQNLTSASNDFLRDRSIPRDLDTAHLYLNVTNLQRSCKRLDYLKKEIESEREKKAKEEKKKKCMLVDSKIFKAIKEEYRELYNEILVQRVQVDSLFDASRRPPDDKEDDQKGSIVSEIQRPKQRPNLLDKDGCEKCREKCAHLEAIAELEKQIAMERSEKEDALQRLGSVASAKLRDKTPNADHCNPTQLAEKLSEIYDNEWTDAFDHLEKCYSNKEEDSVRLLLDVLIEVHQQCANLSENILSNITAPLKPTDIPTEVSKNLKDAVKMLTPHRISTLAKDIKSSLQSRLKIKPGDPFDIYVDKCIEACLLMSVQDPPMYLSAYPDKDGLFSHTTYRTYTKSGKYEQFIVWPVLYLHKNGPMMTKGVAQGTEDKSMIKNNYSQTDQQPVQSQTVVKRHYDYQQRPQQHHHEHEEDWNQYGGMRTSYMSSVNQRPQQYTSHYPASGYSRRQSSTTHDPTTLRIHTTDF